MLLKNGSFYYEKRLVPGDLRVTGETITAFSPQSSGGLTPFADEELLDLGGAEVIPAFLDIHTHGAVGVDVKGNSVSTYDIDDGLNKARIIARSKRAYVVAEARKLSTDGNYDYTPLNALAGLVTDTEPPSDIRAAAAELGVDIVLP